MSHSHGHSQVPSTTHAHDSDNTVSVLDTLKPYSVFGAEYNSQERQDQQTAVCQPDTRERVIAQIMEWAENRDDQSRPICWLHGPAGTGKSSIAHTIADTYTKKHWLVLNFFFFRASRPDRTSLAKFFTTLAYQLAASEALPSAQQFISQVIQKDPRVLTANFETQLQKLICSPILVDTPSKPHIIIIIDGLDECESHDHQTQLVKLLAESSPSLSPYARILVTSRPEEQIIHEFHVPDSAAQVSTLLVALDDFDALDDIWKVCHRGFAEIATKWGREHYIPKDWPSDKDIKQVVQKSQGIFIYITTLLKFVGERGDLPQNKLQEALTTNAVGLDSIYLQVLASAPGKNRHLVISAIVLLQEPLAIVDLEEFLHLTPGEIRVALEGTRSILNIPETDDEAVVPYHASLGDFVQDETRSLSQFSSKDNIMLDHCIQLVMGMMKTEPSGKYSRAILYSCQNWSYHLASCLAREEQLESIIAQVQALEEFVSKIKQQWLRFWLYGLYNADSTRVYITTNIEKMGNVHHQFDMQLKVPTFFKANHKLNNDFLFFEECEKCTVTSMQEVEGALERTEQNTTGVNTLILK